MFPTKFGTGVGGVVDSFKDVVDAPTMVRHRTVSAPADKTVAGSSKMPAAKATPILTRVPIRLTSAMMRSYTKSHGEPVGARNLGAHKRAKCPWLLAKVTRCRDPDKAMMEERIFA
jgi:hypothetical protein